MGNSQSDLNQPLLKATNGIQVAHPNMLSSEVPKTGPDNNNNTNSSTDSLDNIRDQKRTKIMLDHFTDLIPPDQICIADFSCALNKDMLIRQGRLYLSPEYIAFHSPIANTRVVVRVKDVLEIVPRTILMIPSCIDIVTKTVVLNLINFMYRQKAITMIQLVQNDYKKRLDATSENHRGSEISSLIEPPIKSVQITSDQDQKIDGNRIAVAQVVMYSFFGLLGLLNFIVLYRAISLVSSVNNMIN